MDTIRLCKECGTPLTAAAPEGLCPKCLMKVAMGTQPGVSTNPGPGTQAPSALPDPAALAKCFPQLEILELLGQGGMGAVYKARQQGLDRLVALKILPSHAASGPGFAERFNREARALARLSHPNIVAVYDFGQTHGLHYFIMEFVDGANLRQLEQAGRLTPREALKIIPQICEALQFAHDEGIVHRDIKPENVLLDKKGRVKIADFGLARILGREAQEAQAIRLTGARDVMGTPHYMAPEQFEHPQEVDHRADIYSLGVVFYEMLTGELPMGRFAPPSKKVEVDVRLDEVVLRTLEREPARRYQQASEIKTDVETISGLLEKLPAHLRHAVGFEYRSKTTWFGLPLLHVTSGIDPKTGNRRTAKGIIAIGDQAKGVVAIGGVAFGGVAFGGLAVGIIPFGGFTFGLAALGGCAIGLIFSYGGLAVAPIALGGMAIGYLAFGGGAFGPHAVGGNANDPRAQQFFLPWAQDMFFAMNLATLVLVFIAIAISMIVPQILRKQSSAGETKTKSAAGRIVAGTLAAALIPIIVLLLLWSRPGKRFFHTVAEQASASQNPGINQHKVLEINWEELSSEKRLLGGMPVQIDGRAVLKIENTNNAPLQLALFTIEKPPVTAMIYVLSGEIRYENVQGEGYLEMWNVFSATQQGSPDVRAFSRTLGDFGPMGKISGTSGWRPFSLPFNRTGSTEGPSRLEVNIFLPSRGAVFLGPVKLTQS